MYTGFAESAVEVSHRLAPCYEAQAWANGWYFLDAALYAQPSRLDHLHMESASHLALTAAMEQKIRAIFSDPAATADPGPHPCTCGAGACCAAAPSAAGILQSGAWSAWGPLG